jgi:hypothetical protein
MAESSRAAQASVTADAKWIALRNYRRARGQCYTCGERYSREHQCKGTVQLHVLQEVLDLFQGEEASEEDQMSNNSSMAELHLMTTESVVKDPSTLTFQLTGVVQNQRIQFLVDSGSTHSFINNSFIPRFTNVAALKSDVKVKVANGAKMVCDKALLNCPWSCEGHQFTTQFKFLALGAYDGILGLDWLAMHSPMRVDWDEQWMSFDHKGHIVTLQSNNNPSHLLVQWWSCYWCTSQKILQHSYLTKWCRF